MIDDITALRESWGDVPPPSPAAQNQARAALLARVAQTGVVPTGARSVSKRNRRWSGWAWRSGIATVAAAAVVGGLVIVGGLGQGTDATPPGGSAASQSGAAASPSGAAMIELAAAYAAAQPFTAPRSDQWTYVELRIANPGKIAQSKGQQTDVTSQSWTRADGKQTADIYQGKLETSSEQADVSVFPPRDYPTLAGLPTDPQQLLNWIRVRLNGAAATEEQFNSRSFSVIEGMLRENLLPPAVTASLLRALALIPGVVQASEPTEIDGRPVIGVGRVMDGWLQSEILLDPDTHEFVGSQDVAIADHTFTIGPEGAVGGKGTTNGDGPGAQPSSGGSNSGGQSVHITKGEIQSMLIRTAIQVVDAPGKTN